MDLLNGNNSCSSLLLTVMSFGCGAANSVVHKTLNFETHSPFKSVPAVGPLLDAVWTRCANP